MHPNGVSGGAKYPRRQSNALTAVDLFSGAGGLSLGFWQAGGVPIGAVDIDPEAIETYRAMLPIASHVCCGDVESWVPPFEPHQVDVVIGGPPCQGFSLARGFRFVDDPRNHLYRHFVRLVGQLRPKWVVMENVPGITSLGKGVLLAQVLQDFEGVGYSVECKVVNMANYGVPQTRKRAIFVGNADGAKVPWPEATHQGADREQLSLISGLRRFVSVGEALGDLPWPLGKFFAHRANSQMRGPRNRVTQLDPAFTLRVRGDEFAFCDTPAAGAFVPGPVPRVSLAYSAARNGFQRAMRERPPMGIRKAAKWNRIAATRSPVLVGTRRLSVREQARLQTFPDWFAFSGGAYSQGRQIGNAVPPLFARQLFRGILANLAQAH